MTSASVDRTLVLIAVAMLLGSQATLWWRAGRAAPQATLLAAVTQTSALGVLALSLQSAGLARPATVVAAMAATGFVGMASGARSTGHAARASGSTWVAEHRRGLRSTIVAVEAVVAAVALVMTVSWAADRFNADFDRKADGNLCRLLNDGC